MTEIQSLARGLKILTLLAESQQGVSITELAESLGVDKASASRLVSTLRRYGYAEKDETTRRVRLGSQVISLSRGMLSRLPLREAVRPYLQQLMERTGECAHLAILAQGKALYIDQVEAPATLRVNAQVGTMNPLHCTALGKVLLAFSHQDLPADLPLYTDRTITNRQALHRHLEEVRAQGYAVDDEEFDAGVRCIAAPIQSSDGRLAGTLGISGPSTRMIPERLPELAAIVVEVGLLASERLMINI